MVLSSSQRSFLLFLFFLEVVVLSLFFCPSPSRGGGDISLIALPRLWVYYRRCAACTLLALPSARQCTEVVYVRGSARIKE